MLAEPITISVLSSGIGDHLMATRCQSCRATFPRSDAETCSRCGGETVHIAVRTPPRKRQDPEGARKVKVCRSNPCGHYDAENDTCKLVIQIGVIKGQKRAGRVLWLLAHPDAVCPDQPDWFEKDRPT